MGELKIKGMAELKAALATLPVKIENNILRQALRKGVKVIEAEAKAQCPARSGELRATIRSDVKKDKDRGRLVGYVKAGPKSLKKGEKRTRENNKGWYGRLVEFGTAAHKIAARPPNKRLAIGVREVMHPGAKPRPFMRPAFDTKQGAAVEAMKAYIRKRLATKHGIHVPEPEPGSSEEAEE
jgi:HK97 gp10 family phage protein